MIKKGSMFSFRLSSVDEDNLIEIHNYLVSCGIPIQNLTWSFIIKLCIHQFNINKSKLMK